MAIIFHFDLDSFYVSAERLKNPSLRGKCVAVGGQGGRGVISSASYEARKFGVKSAMPVQQALRLCPKLVLVDHDFELYSRLSKMVFDIISTFAPVWEAVSIDEGYMDMTGSEALFGTPIQAAQTIRARVLKETGLTCSIGIGANRRIAKITTDFCKPNGVHWVPPGTEAAFLAPMPVGKIPGVGPSTENWLHRRGVFTIGELQKLSADTLRSQGKFGEFLFEAARGEGSTEFNREAKNPSMSRETTFEKNLHDPLVVEKELWSLVADLGAGLREERKYAHGLRLKLRYPPFDTVVRSSTLPEPAHSDSTLFEAFRQLLHDHWDDQKPLRLLGVGCTLTDAPAQLDLFADHSELRKRETLDRLKDGLRQKFGDNALKTGRDL